MPIEKACENCGQPFFSYPSDNRRFCSLQCRSAKRFDKGIPAPGREFVRFACHECGNEFGMMKSYLDAYQKKHGRDPMYCSRQCSGDAHTRKAEERNTFTCATCAQTFSRSRKPGGRIYREQKYCSPECRHEMIRRRAYNRFSNGELKRHVKRHGYIWISVPALANNGVKTEMLEHRYVMQQKLGRPLFKAETVHHINGNRQDNRIENLELFSSRHGPGQRVIDKVDFAIEMLQLYPEFARAKGVMLVPVPHEPTDATAPESQPERPSPSCRSDPQTAPDSRPAS
jgi:hypothetical protein